MEPNQSVYKALTGSYGDEESRHNGNGQRES